MTYQQLPMVEPDIDNLRLDLENYRIPTRPDDEGAALNYLYAEEDVLGAARMILRDGYFDNEVPIVIEETPGVYRVLEGNRRVSALKGLLNPDAVPAHSHDLRALLRRYELEAEDLPTAIRVLVAPDRDAAAPHIARLHTTVPKKRWSRDQQANYYYSLLSPHRTVTEIRAMHPGADVVRFIKMAVMRRFLSGVHFTDLSLHGYVSGAALTMSAFEYAYRNADIAYAIGAMYDGDGFLLPVSHRPEKVGATLTSTQRSAVEYLMNEFRAKRLNTRSAAFKKDTPENQILVARLLGTPVDPKGPETPVRPVDPDDPATDPIDDPDGESGEDDPALPPGGPGGGGARPAPNPRGPNHPDTRNRLSLSGLDYTTGTPENLQLRYQELRRIDISQTPVAAALLLRSALETTIKFHFEGATTPASGELTAVMKVVSEAYGNDKALRNAINQIQSGGAEKPGSVQWHNLASHSADLVVKPQDVRDAYRLAENLLRHLLRPRPTP
ncbi:MAG: hypothetical protein ACRCSN_15835 [Dermatophilaceae bacterium]